MANNVTQAASPDRLQLYCIVCQKSVLLDTSCNETGFIELRAHVDKVMAYIDKFKAAHNDTNHVSQPQIIDPHGYGRAV